MPTSPADLPQNAMFRHNVTVSVACDAQMAISKNKAELAEIASQSPTFACLG